ncbi:three-Cys-motif partner protein TcmP [Methanobacterium sp. BAmetb5]|uniref:three-Cys-motif partner protein TcmP n=1 Tax=Methanobacterium sp. BAmetb5 TaxID=2025351 RepID=UPI0025EEFB67|nr:three-Cys-motif partner protein TcmP [Methanobacterium sp. BAmetb5]
MPHRDDSLEKWAYKEHTKVKHEILSKYLSGWIRILGSHNKKVCYFDCFAGRGKYADGEDGSPLIALETACRIKDQFEYIDEIVCTFIEKDKNNYNNLKAVIDAEKDNAEKYDKINILNPINDEFSNLVAEIREIRGRLAPSFFFIDPFGFGGVPFEDIKYILSLPKTEVFFNFMVRDVNRFLTSSKHRISIEELFGFNNVSDILEKKYSHLTAEQSLLRLYRDQLHNYASVKYTLPYKVNADDKLQTTYYLIHATNHPLGCALMKGVMYSIGTEGRFGYLGPAEGQMTLESYGDLSQFKEFLLDRFQGKTLSFKEIQELSCMETFFIEKHYRQAVKELYGDEIIDIQGLGPRGGIKKESQIVFPKMIS